MLIPKYREHNLVWRGLDLCLRREWWLEMLLLLWLDFTFRVIVMDPCFILCFLCTLLKELLSNRFPFSKKCDWLGYSPSWQLPYVKTVMKDFSRAHSDVDIFGKLTNNHSTTAAPICLAGVDLESKPFQQRSDNTWTDDACVLQRHMMGHPLPSFFHLIKIFLWLSTFQNKNLIMALNSTASIFLYDPCQRNNF